jgi:hypothetical protein
VTAGAVPKGRYELDADDDDVIGLTIAKTYPSGWAIVRTDPPSMDACDEYAVAQFVLGQINKAAAIGTCSEREKRAAMTDAEFWAHVYPDDPNPNVVLPGWGEGDEALDYDLASSSDPCPICHAAGACGWDDEGRPFIHAIGDAS